MTMQIAMVGTDGIVLASDTRQVNNEATVRHTSEVSKIKINQEKGVAIACSRSLELASRIADDMLNELSEIDWSLLAIRSIPIAEKILDGAKEGRRDFQCLIVTTKPALAAFHLCAGVYPQQKHPTCQRISSCEIAGDTINQAVFWPERYYWRFPSLPHGIQQLVPLAAQTIFSAAEFSRDSIYGLEIVICDKNGLRRLSDTSIKKLRVQSQRWDEKIGTFFANYTRRFEFDSAKEF